jgi:SAM-dependent methyltransferase
VQQQVCPLCFGNAIEFFAPKYFECSSCAGVFCAPEYLPNANSEKQRYELHENDIQDAGYNAFVAPLVNAVIQHQQPMQSALDFGAGPSSAVAHNLQKCNFNIALYDPFFHNQPELLQLQYDFIICCEVIEHFHKPNESFEILRGCLQRGGRLYCMTHILTTEVDFEKWYYKNDFTHVFFYRPETLQWIKQHFNFKSLTIANRLIVFDAD